MFIYRVEFTLQINNNDKNNRNYHYYTFLSLTLLNNSFINIYLCANKIKY